MARSSRPTARTRAARTGTRCPERRRSASDRDTARRCLEVEPDTLERPLRRLAAAAAVARVDRTDQGGAGDLPAVQRHALTTWRRERRPFTELELLVLEYVESVTATPPTVADDLIGALIARLGHRQLVELTAVVAMESLRSRIMQAGRGQQFGGEVAGDCALASTS